MLGQFIKTLAQIEAWRDHTDTPQRADKDWVHSKRRVSDAEGYLELAIDECLHISSERPSGIRFVKSERLVMLMAKTAVNAILAILHLTKDEAQTGLVLVTVASEMARAMANERAQVSRLRAHNAMALAQGANPVKRLQAR